MKKALSLFLAVVMVVGLLPASVISISAEPTKVTLSNDGSSSADYDDLNNAINAIADGGTIEIVGTYTYASDYVWTDHNKNVTITGDGNDTLDVKCGTWNIHDGVTFTNLTLNKNGGNIYANGNPLKISEDVNMPYKVSIIGGGGTGGVVINGDTNLEIYAGSFTYIFGSGFECTVKGDTHVTVGGNANSQYSVGSGWQPGIYGGGYQNGTGDIVEGNTYVTIKGNAKANHVLGGAAIGGSQVKGDCHVTVEGGEIYRVLGGGRGVNANNTFVTVTGGNVRYIHGGSANAKVLGDTHVYVGGTTNQVAGASNGACDPANHGAQNFKIFGGGYSESSSYKNSVVGNTYVTVEGNIKANGVYGGGDAYSEGVGGTAYVNVNGGTFMTVYGGGYQSPVHNTAVTMTGGTIEQLFGGAEGAAVTGNTIVRVLGGNISRRIYGGSYNNYESLSWKSAHGVAGTSAVVIGKDANITLDYDDSDCSIFAGSRHENDTDGTTILAYLDAAAAAKYRTASYQGAQDITYKLIVGSKAVADEIHTLSHSISGNVITETCTDSGCGHHATASLELADDANLNYANGEAIEPAIIEYSGTWLAEELNGEITYANNDTVGTATATAMHSRLGAVTLNFEIVENLIEVYNEDKAGDDKIAFSSLFGKTLNEYTTYRLMENIDLGDKQVAQADKITLAHGVVFDGDGHSITNFDLNGGKEVSLFTAHNGSKAITATIQNITFGSETAKIVFDHDGGKYDGWIGFALVGQTGSDDTLILKGLTAYVNGDDCKGNAWQDYAIFLGRNNGKVTIDDCKAYGSLKGHGFLGGFIGQNASAQAVEIKNSINYASVSVNGSRYYGGFIGLNGNANSNVTIRNCVNNGIIAGEGYTGGFVGETKGTLTVIDCTNNANVTATRNGELCVGGIVGKLTSGTLNVSGSVNNGKIVGSNNTTVGDFVGGILGVMANGTAINIDGCENSGTVVGSSTAQNDSIGGIVGNVAGGTEVIINCVNKGNVYGARVDGTKCGGIVGVMEAIATGSKIENCHNEGKIGFNSTDASTATAIYSGGIAGFTRANAFVNYCTNSGQIIGYQQAGGIIASPNAAVTVKNCSNKGSVSYTHKTANDWYGAGGIIAYINAQDATIENCNNSGTISGIFAGGAMGGFNGAKTLSITGFANRGTVNATYAGGVVGHIKAATVSILNSVNEGAITGSSMTGGMIGQISANNTSLTVNGSANLGYVKSTNGHAGGVVGGAHITSGTITVNGFYHAGTVESTSSSGGIVGVSEPKQSNAKVDNSALTIDVDNAVITGDVKGKWRGCAITGYVYKATITMDNCFATGTMTQTSNNSVSWAFTDNANEGSITGSGNYAVNGKQLTTARPGFTETCGASVATILEKVNANQTIVNGFGRFTLNSEGKNIVRAVPEYEGYQKSAVVNGEYSIRLLATINDVNLSTAPIEYKYLGFELSKNGGETYTSIYTDYVYNSVIATKDGGEQITYTAGELGGAYIYALIIDGISVETGTTLTVRTFAVDQSGNMLYGDAATIVLPGNN